MSDPWQAGGTALIQCAANDTIEIYGYAQNGRSILDAETISWVTFAVIPFATRGRQDGILEFVSDYP